MPFLKLAFHQPIADEVRGNQISWMVEDRFGRVGRSLMALGETWEPLKMRMMKPWSGLKS